MAPGDMVMSLDNVLCFNGMMIGTALCVFSANSFNQWLEVPFDAQMKRTCNRPLVRGAIRPVHALGMACAFGVTGTATLLAFCCLACCAIRVICNMLCAPHQQAQHRHRMRCKPLINPLELGRLVLQNRSPSAPNR